MGVPQVTVPDVTGKSADDATKILHAGRSQGRGHHVLRRPRAPADARAAGKVVDQGTTVTDPGELLRCGPLARRSARTSRSRAAWPGGLAYTDAVGAGRRAGLRRQPARLEADRRRPGAGRAVHRGLHRARRARRSSTRRTWSTSARRPRPRSSSRSPRSRTTCARGAAARLPRAWSCTPGSAVGEDRYDAALRQLRERLLPVLDALPDDGPRLLIEPTAGGGKALAATVEDLGPYLAALDGPPAGRRLLRHLPRVGGRARPLRAGRDDGDPRRARGHRRPRPARAGARQRLARRLRLQARPAHDDRRGLDRGRAVRASCWPTRRWPASRWSWRRRASSTARRPPATRATSPCCARCGMGGRRAA